MIEGLDISVFDIAVIGLLVIGGLIGLTTGFVRGGLFVASWIGAILVTLYGFPLIQPFARQSITNPTAADLVGGSVLFLVSLVFFHIFSHMFSGWVRHSRLNVLDRSLGLVAGIISAAVVVSTAFLLLSDLAPADQPTWLREARSRPFVEITALFIRDFLPEDIRTRFGVALENSRNGVDRIDQTRRALELLNRAPPAAIKPTDPGYSDNNRTELNRLIEGNQ